MASKRTAHIGCGRWHFCVLLHKAAKAVVKLKVRSTFYSHFLLKLASALDTLLIVGAANCQQLHLVRHCATV